MKTPQEAAGLQPQQSVTRLQTCALTGLLLALCTGLLGMALGWGLHAWWSHRVAQMWYVDVAVPPCGCQGCRGTGGESWGEWIDATGTTWRRIPQGLEGHTPAPTIGF